MDTPLDDTIGKVFDDQSDDSQIADTEVVEATKPAKEEAEAETPKPEAETEESFTPKPVDLNSLPSELQEVYKDWQRAYTHKRQAEKAELAELRAELERRNSQPDEESENSYDEDLTPEERAREEARKVFREEQQNLWVEQARKDYLEIDERLNDDLPTHDPYLDEFLQNRLDAEVEAYGAENGSVVGFDYKSKAKELIKEWDAHVENLVKGFVQKQRDMSRERADKTKKLNPEVSPAQSRKAQGTMSLEEAAEAAFAES